MSGITTGSILDCRACFHWVNFLDDVSTEYPDYPAWPVMQFAIKKPTLLLPAK